MILLNQKTASNLLKPIAIKNNYLTTENHRKTKYLWYIISYYRTPKNCYQIIKASKEIKLITQ